MAIGSRRAVSCGVRHAMALRMPPHWGGALVVSVGIDIVEVLRSIVATTQGRGEIATDDAIGSVFTSSTLILALRPVAARGVLPVDGGECLQHVHSPAQDSGSQLSQSAMARFDGSKPLASPPVARVTRAARGTSSRVPRRVLLIHSARTTHLHPRQYPLLTPSRSCHGH